MAVAKMGSARFITARKRSLGQGNIFIGVCQEFCSQGGLPQCILGYPPPQGQTPPRPPGPGTPARLGTPPEQTPPLREQSMLGDTVNERAVRILLECNLVDVNTFINTQNYRKTN